MAKSSLHNEVSFVMEMFKLTDKLSQSMEWDTLELAKYFREIKKYNNELVSDDEFETIIKQYIPGLDSDYSKEFAFEKIKSSLEMIAVKLIALLKVKVIEIQSNYVALTDYKRQMEDKIKKSRERLNVIYQFKELYSKDFSSKEALLSHLKLTLTRCFRGDLYLNNSVNSLTETLNKILNVLFDQSKMNLGRGISTKNELQFTIDNIKYFISGSEINKVKTANLMKSSPKTIQEEIAGLPPILKSDLDTIINYIRKVNQPSIDSKPDEPQGNAISWDATIDTLIKTWKKGEDYYNNEISRVLRSLISVNVETLTDIVKNIEEIYRLKSTEEGRNNMNALDATISNYITLFNINILSLTFDLELKSYDFLTYDMYLEYFIFICNFIFYIGMTYQDYLKDLQARGNSLEQPNQIQ